MNFDVHITNDTFFFFYFYIAPAAYTTRTYLLYLSGARVCCEHNIIIMATGWPAY